MTGLSIFRTSTLVPFTLVSSSRHPVTLIAGLAREAGDLVTTAAAVSPTTLSSPLLARARTLDTASRRTVWATIHPALSVGGVSATRGSSGVPVAARELPDEPATTFAGSPEPRPAAPDAGGPADGAQPENPVKPPSAIAKVELSIDSLRTYELSRPIPVIVESLGERNYVADVPDLNISTSASNPSDILITLKDRVAQLYDELRLKKNLDREQARQLRVLESYITTNKSRRSWLDRR